MAKGTKTGGRNFVPGDPRAGRPRLPDEIKQLCKFTKGEIAATFARFIGLSINELERVLTDKNLTVLEHWVGRVALMGIKTGDPIRLEWLLRRIFGAEIENVINEVDDPELLRNIPSDKIMKLIKESDDDGA